MMLLYLDKDDFETAREISMGIKPKLQKLLPQDVEQREMLDAMQNLFAVEKLQSALRKSAKQEQKSQIWRYGALFREIKDGRIEKVSEILQIDSSLINGVDKNWCNTIDFSGQHEPHRNAGTSYGVRSRYFCVYKKRQLHPTHGG